MLLNEFIKENPTINVTVSGEDLLIFGKEIASKTASEILDKKEEKLYTPKEIEEKFGVCTTTVWRWRKLGILESKKIGNRVYFTESSIQSVIEKKG
ncbi:MAG: helix-turn-helix domain-containing protein [Bacteroidetes bacterium]|jgi:hypothetical protein|nr:helix-turn-helix domain-containing protein [Bacteroidota bacterium]MBT7143945.1 helix-turn-helix domain-containing protein [Bacteroidota bacterium]